MIQRWSVLSDATAVTSVIKGDHSYQTRLRLSVFSDVTEVIGVIRRERGDQCYQRWSKVIRRDRGDQCYQAGKRWSGLSEMIKVIIIIVIIIIIIIIINCTYIAHILSRITPDVIRRDRGDQCYQTRHKWSVLSDVTEVISVIRRHISDQCYQTWQVCLKPPSAQPDPLPTLKARRQDTEYRAHNCNGVACNSSCHFTADSFDSWR